MADTDNTHEQELTRSEDLTDVKQPAYSSIFESEYIHQGNLGKGAFGVVFQAQNILDKVTYAIKRITLPRSEEIQEKFKREILVLAQVVHPNIVRYFHAWTELPPPGWQEQRDKQLDISENTDSGIEFDSPIGNSVGSQTEPLNLSDNSDNKGIADKLQNVFGQEEFSSNSEIQSENSDTWESYDAIRRTLDKEKDKSSAQDDKRSEAVNQLFQGKSSTACTQNQPIANGGPQNKFIEKVDSVKEETVEMSKQKCFYYIKMEFCKPETLAYWLKTNTLNRDTQQVVNWFVQTLSAVQYLHDEGFIHRDLKPSNIFFSAENVIKVGDFGFATELEEELHVNIYPAAGTLLYMCPEILNKHGKVKSNKVDIYSLGVILFEMLFSFHTQSERVRTLKDLKKLQFPDNFTREMPEKKDLVTQMLAHKPEERPTAEQIHNQIIFTPKTNTTRRNSV